MIGAFLAIAALVAPHPAHAAATTSIGIGLREFRVATYRPTVKPGRLKLNLTNRGEDVHDIAVRRAGKTIARSALVPSGGRATLRLKLTRPGTYVLRCTLADHAALGMRATLRVRR